MVDQRMGRTPKLTPAVRQALVDAIARGQSRAVATELAGIGERTLFRWLARGRSENKGEYWQFWQEIKKAEAQAVAEAVSVIRRAAERDEVTVKRTVGPDGSVTTVTTTRTVLDWTAAAWWLERRYPREWANNRREVKELRQQLAALVQAIERGRFSAPAAVEGS